MKPSHQIPSPYGPLLNVFHDPNRSERLGGPWFLDMDGVLTMAGIHDRRQREASFEDIRRRLDSGEPLSIYDIEKYGGRKVSPVAIGHPEASAYQALLAENNDTCPIESWVDMTLGTADWHKRSGAYQGTLRQTLEECGDAALPTDMRSAIIASRLSMLLTASIEHLHEREISCIQQAAFYAVTVHPEWISAALNWLEPIRDTWFADWLKSHPAYVNFARICRLANPDLPAWIAGDRT